MDSVNYIINFLKHKLKAKNQHGIHSPFVFDLYNNVLANRIPFYIFDDIESIRAKLLLSPQNITITDLGAGSKKMASNRRKIADITKYTSKKPKIAQLLFRLVNYLKPQTILELGTSVGISSMYMAASNSRAKVITVEGDPKIAQIAQKITTDCQKNRRLPKIYKISPLAAKNSQNATTNCKKIQNFHH